MRRSLSCLSILLLVPACSKSATPISIDITAGQETTAFTDAKVTSCNVTLTSLDGTIKTSATAAVGQTFDFSGDISGDEQVSVAVTCTDSGGNQVMAGQSLSGLLLSAVTSDIPVFVQRTEQWARPPGGLACAHLGGVATYQAERFMTLTGGTRATGDTTCDMTAVDTYDLFALAGDAPAIAFNPLPQSIVSLGSELLLIAPAGAVLDDISGGADPYTETAPAPLQSFADVAGGAVVLGPTSTFVVGATRTGTPSDKVLEVASDGTTLTGYQLTSPRAGAAAAWVDNVGLVIAGGSATAPGLEVLGATSTAFATRPYVPLPVAGAGAVTDGNSGIYLFGGVDAGNAPAPTRHLQASCNPCMVVTLDTPMLPPLAGVSAYQLSAARDLVVGADGTGMFASFIVDATNEPAVTVTPVALREPRKGATPFPAPNGTLALLGGQHMDGTPALSIELFQPQLVASGGN